MRRSLTGVGQEGWRGGVKGRVGLAEWEGGGQQRAQRSERGLPGGACVEGTTSYQSVTVEPEEPDSLWVYLTLLQTSCSSLLLLLLLL